MISHLRPALSLLIVFSVVTGIAYPMLVTGIGQAAFPYEAHGSLVLHNHQLVGSALLGQPFSAPGYFWSRPSATTPMPYNAASSGGSNLGPLNPALVDAVKARVAALREAGDADGAIPADLVTASASGLDPGESVAAALFQVPRIARVRHLPVDKVRALVDAHTQSPELGFLGEARVNVLLLNLALDQLDRLDHAH